ncbi:hypothetical protein [Acidovorax sp. BL-A-41-H1]|uniref:hypothetical protein n=1 Tax=Acidovorax sp. BL-A-41-H1 TaxID=3421102 RepID=UPI003F7B088C
MQPAIAMPCHDAVMTGCSTIPGWAAAIAADRYALREFAIKIIAMEAINQRDTAGFYQILAVNGLFAGGGVPGAVTVPHTCLF